MRAYFTVEAALVLPFTIWIWVSLIYIMFFQYDRCLMEQDVAMLAVRGSASWEWDGAEAVDIVRRQAAAMDRDRFLAFRYGALTIEMVLGKLTVAVDGEVLVPFQQLLRWVRKEDWQIQAQYASRRLEPVLVIRSCRKLLQEEWED